MCGPTQKCCENVNTKLRACKSLCATPKEVEVAISSAGVACGTTTCASGQVCCRCLARDCRDDPPSCMSACDGTTYGPA